MSEARKTITVDAAGKSFGRLASEVATYLIGKHEPSYTYEKDCGSNVVVEHYDRVTFSGKKLEQKAYYRYSGYPGGMTKTLLKDALAKDSKEVLRKAVYKMLQKNTHRDRQIKRLTIS